MSFLVVLLALVFLMFVAYRGYSVIMFAPVAALLAVLLTDPVARCCRCSPACSWTRWSASSRSTFPVFMLGAIFGKVIELSGFSKSIVSSVIQLRRREARDAVDRCRLRDPDLRRRISVRRRVRRLSVRCRDVQAERHSQASDPGNDRARAPSRSRWTRCPGPRRSRTSYRRRSSRRRPTPQRGSGSSAQCSSCWSVLPTSNGAAARPLPTGEGYGTNLQTSRKPFEDEKLRQSVDRDPAAGRGRRAQQGVHRRSFRGSSGRA